MPVPVILGSVLTRCKEPDLISSLVKYEITWSLRLDDVRILKDCLTRPSDLYRLERGPSLEVSEFFFRTSSSRYVRKQPLTRLALQQRPSVHLLMPASRSSHTNTAPERIRDARSSSNKRREIRRGGGPRFGFLTLSGRSQAARSRIASAGDLM